MENKLERKDIIEYTIELFEAFKDFCAINKLTYWAAFGTMLGAVRHNDFIPWDDDFDVFMPRKDYDYLVKHFNSFNKDSTYNVLHFSTAKHYPYAIARINDSRFTTIVDGKKTKYGLGIFIDIYPLDGVNLDDKRYIRKLKRYRLMVDFKIRRYTKSKNIVKNCVKFPLYLLTQIIPIKHILKKLDTIAKKYKFKDSDFCGDICWDPRFKFKCDWFSDSICWDYHGTKINVPIGYNDFLTYVYGDYMKLPPVEKRIGYHYEKILKNEN